MDTLIIAVVGPSSREVAGPLFKEVARQVTSHLGQRIAVEPLRLGRKYHAVILEDGVPGVAPAAHVVTEVVPPLRGADIAVKMDLLRTALTAAATKAMLVDCAG